MSATRTEQILARVAVVLAALPGVTVERYKGRALSAGDLPALIVAREGTQHDQSSFENVQTTAAFALRIYVTAGEGTETAADALHAAAHALLIADATLAGIGASTLRCVATESEPDELDAEYTRLVAHYQIDAWSAADLSTPV